MNESRRKTIAGVLLIFSVYFYFLIFAQFAFVELALQSGAAESVVRQLMGAMAAGGLLGSFILPVTRMAAERLLRISLAACLVLALTAGANLPMAFLTGLSMGAATVSLSTALPSLLSPRWGLWVSFGTGLAYFACNVPAIFRAPPHVQSVLAGLICGCSALLVPRMEDAQPRVPGKSWKAVPSFLIVFGILVWLDSAAFYIIQHSPLKEGTWGGTFNLWRNAFVHLFAAIIGGMLAEQKGFRLALTLAFILLAPASLLANSTETRALGGWLYPAGVSIYSACLAAFPGFGPGNQLQAPALRAAMLYTLSGWICSGLGIGMGQNLHRIPGPFVAGAAGVLIAVNSASLLARWWRELTLAGGIILTAIIFSVLRPHDQQRVDGRRVYLSEGCINCHSQFIRSNSRDELLWGPPQPIEPLRGAAPPLFGNRRQGPDLLNIGNRRSRAWLKEHFINPRQLAPGSSMPSYAYLFHDSRGEALLDFLQSLGSGSSIVRAETIHNWQLRTNTVPQVSGDRLFSAHCVLCHDGSLRGKFLRPPPNLVVGPYIFAPLSLGSEARQQRLAQIIKFGIPGTDMPGHEYFSDEEVFALTVFVERLSTQNESPRSRR